MAHWNWVLASAFAVSMADASVVAAQQAMPDSVRRIAAIAAQPMMLISVSKGEKGALIVEFEADEFFYDKLRQNSWPSLRIGANGEPASQSLSKVGQSIARTIWKAVPSENQIESIVLLFRSDNARDDPSRVRLAYPVSELSAINLGGTLSLPKGIEQR